MASESSLQFQQELSHWPLTRVTRIRSTHLKILDFCLTVHHQLGKVI